MTQMVMLEKYLFVVYLKNVSCFTSFDILMHWQDDNMGKWLEIFVI